jgi:hypothetical protein
MTDFDRNHGQLQMVRAVVRTIKTSSRGEKGSDNSCYQANDRGRLLKFGDNGDIFHVSIYTALLALILLLDLLLLYLKTFQQH